MKKTDNSGNIVNAINDIINTGRERGLLHLNSEDQSYNGRTIQIKGNEYINFGSCSYLGLELDKRLKASAIDAIEKFGIQYSSSRAFVSATPYEELENLVKQIFDAPIVLTPTTTLGHIAVIGVVVRTGDLIILDQQVHASVQYPSKSAELRGVPNIVVRHNNLSELEDLIKQNKSKYKKIWYMIDGIYSMYGDFAPMEKLVELLNTYNQLHLYIDDAHGMSWAGQNGQGFALSRVKLHPRMIIGTSFAKGFGTGGGAFVFPDPELCQEVRNCGGPLIFSGPNQIPVLAASIASAKIHLSPEIYIKQNELKLKMNLCHKLLTEYNLPVISNPETPINFIGLGLTRVGYNMVKRMMNDGCYTNLAVFPAVPETCTGLRFTITNHHTINDIEKIAERLAHHLPKALSDEGRTINDIHRAFRRVANFDESKKIGINENKKVAPRYKVSHEKTIQNISREVWNNLLGNQASLDWDGMVFLEKTFQENELPEYNWEFHYFIIHDQEGVPVLATYFTHLLIKDDMLSPASISQKIEIERLIDPYYLCSKTLMMGCVMSVGKHLYIDRSRVDWKNIMMLLLDTVWILQDELKANSLNYRDFDDEDLEIKSFFMDQGFIKVALPDTHIIEKPNWIDNEDYLRGFSTKRRYNLKQEVFKLESHYEIKIIKNCSEDQLEQYYQLYKNVASKSFEITGFDLPKKLFKNMDQFPNWEIIELKLTKPSDKRKDRLPVAVCFCYKTKYNYNFLIVGIDYKFIDCFNVYKQAVWQAISRSNKVGASKVNLGLTATYSKRKFGAKAIPQVAYLQIQDNYNLSVINSYSNSGIIKDRGLINKLKVISEESEILELETA